MSTKAPALAEEASDSADTNYLTVAKGWRAWAFTLDHKRIGIMYLIAVGVAFMLGGLFALGVRIHLLKPDGVLFSNLNYNRVFTLHGAVMVFLFIIPSIPASLGNLILPLMLGAKDVALPRLNLASFWVYCIGGLFFVASIACSGLDTGWTFYAPYSTGGGGEGSAVPGAVLLAATGVFIIGFSSIFTGLNFIVTVHKLRAKGMTWFKLPLFAWSLYATSIIQVVATPVVGITMCLVVAERLLGIGIFDSAQGGDPVLYEHFFWFYSHPAVYIMILPGLGIVSELIAVHSQKKIFGYKAIAYSSMAIALVSFIVWGHHMFVSGQSPAASAVFSFLTFLVGVPTAIKLFNWVATLYKGTISLTTPMLYGLAFIALFTIGGLTGVFLAALNIDLHLHDTYFVVAHFHYTMVGGTTIAFLGGLHHWWCKYFGRMYPEKWGRRAFWFVFFGFNLTFIPQFVLGSRGMPRRYATYDTLEKLQGIDPNYLDLFTRLHHMSTGGSILLGAGIMIIVVYLVRSVWGGQRAPGNPWGGVSLEWKTTSPPALENFAHTPVVSNGPYDFGVEEAVAGEGQA